MKFIMKDNLGIGRDCYSITKFFCNNKEYVIYTDFLPTAYEDFRLFVGRIINGKMVRVTGLDERIILYEFKLTEGKIINKLKEILG